MNHYRQVVEATIAYADRSLTPPGAPLIAFARALAVQMDEANGQPSARLSHAYLSALRALARRAGAIREPRTTGKPARSDRCPDGPRRPDAGADGGDGAAADAFRDDMATTVPADPPSSGRASATRNGGAPQPAVDAGTITDIRDGMRPDGSGGAGTDRDRRWAGQGIVVLDEGGTVLLCNEEAEELFGRSVDGLVGLDLGFLLSNGNAFVDVLTPDGRTRAIAMRSAPTTLRTFRAHLVKVWDANDRRMQAQDLDGTEDLFARAFDNNPVGLAVLDADLRFRVVNGPLCRMLACTSAELTGLTAADVTRPEDRAEEAALALDLLAGTIHSYELEKQFVTPGGRLVWGHLKASLLNDPSGPSPRIIAAIEDITDPRQAQARLARRALHDPLTGLANRALAMDRLSLAQARAERTRHYAAVLLLDLDRFKAVNDSLGHDAGNAVLVETARRLETVLRPTDTAARLGGDEFLVCCEGLGTDEPTARAAAIEVAKRIAGALARPVTLASGRTETTASIGIALVNGAQPPTDVLLRHADSAMYRAKEKAEGGPEVSDETHRAFVASRVQIAEDLRRALSRDELAFLYQPIVRISDGRIIGAEALVRWNHPSRGLLLPADFIDVAEESGLIIPLGDAILKAAVSSLREWRRTIRPDLVVMVNASPRQLGCNELGVSVTDALETSGLEPDALHIELTEGTLIEASGSTLAELKTLRDIGVHVGLDDFGTGYASLTSLQRLPVDFVKIDGSFVAGVRESPEGRAIIAAVIGLGHALGLRVIAEGIESEAQRRVLQAMGCELGQGWHFGHPQPAEELARLLKAQE